MADCESFLGSHDTLLFPTLDGHDAENILTADFASEIFREVDNLHRVDVQAEVCCNNDSSGSSFKRRVAMRVLVLLTPRL